MSKEERFEIFNEDGKWVIKDNEKLPHLLDLYKSCVRLNEFVDKLADLEAKLAEKEQRVAELECKLNEKQKAESGRGWRLENGKVIYYCNLLSDYKMERSLEDVVKDLNQMTKESDNVWEMRTLYQGLKNELAEKEAELEKYKKPQLVLPANKIDIEELKQGLNDAPCIVVGLDTNEPTMQSLDQDKIEFAVELLAQVKEDVSPNFTFKIFRDWFDDYMDKKIKQLKEGK